MKKYYGLKIKHPSGAVIRTRAMFKSAGEALDYGLIWFEYDLEVYEEFGK